MLDASETGANPEHGAAPRMRALMRTGALYQLLAQARRAAARPLPRLAPRRLPLPRGIPPRRLSQKAYKPFTTKQRSLRIESVVLSDPPVYASLSYEEIRWRETCWHEAGESRTDCE